MFSVDFDFDVNVTGGNVAWSFYADLRPDEGDDGRIITNLIPIPPSGHVGKRSPDELAAR